MHYHQLISHSIINWHTFFTKINLLQKIQCKNCQNFTQQFKKKRDKTTRKEKIKLFKINKIKSQNWHIHETYTYTLVFITNVITKLHKHIHLTTSLYNTFILQYIYFYIWYTKLIVLYQYLCDTKNIN